jgi:hypothetical protein
VRDQAAGCNHVVDDLWQRQVLARFAHSLDQLDKSGDADAGLAA